MTGSTKLKKFSEWFGYIGTGWVVIKTIIEIVRGDDLETVFLNPDNLFEYIPIIFLLINLVSGLIERFTDDTKLKGTIMYIVVSAGGLGLSAYMIFGKHYYRFWDTLNSIDFVDYTNNGYLTSVSEMITFGMKFTSVSGLIILMVIMLAYAITRVASVKTLNHLIFLFMICTFVPIILANSAVYCHDHPKDNFFITVGIFLVSAILYGLQITLSVVACLIFMLVLFVVSIAKTIWEFGNIGGSDTAVTDTVTETAETVAETVAETIADFTTAVTV